MSAAGKGSGLEHASTVDELWTQEEKEAELYKILSKDVENQYRALASVVETFQEIGSLVHVRGWMGTALGVLVKAFPWIRGINFDLHRVVAKAPAVDGVVHVGGNIFKQALPQAGAIMLMRVLCYWGDLTCIEILKKCKEAISMDKGKVIIVVNIIDEDDKEARTGYIYRKERTAREWAKLIQTAGFRRLTVKHMQGAIASVIEAFP